jgi:hypothetical protein
VPNIGFRIAADTIVVLHVAFVIFVVAGGLLTLRWRWLAWVHVPAAIWGTVVEFAGWVCPLTPVENALRAYSGTEVYRGDFIEHYILPLLYPAQLTRSLQFLIGSFALALNVVVYWYVLTHRHHERRSRTLSGSSDSS